MKINWTLIRYLFGVLLLLEAAFMAVAVAVAVYYHYTVGDNDWWALLLPTLITVALGGTFLLTSRTHSKQITTREGFLVVSLTWVVFCVLGMLPYLMTGICHSVTDAFLETMAGFTTTGCTVLEDIDSQPHGILFWRCMTQWIGGLGIVVFSLALLPLIGTGATQIFGAETNGLSVDKLRPRIQETARRLWGFYLALTVLCAVLYRVGEMSWFDAVCHSLSTLASGGFSTHQASIGYYHSAYIEYVCIVFLFITSINYNLFYFFMRGKFRMTWNNEELRWWTFIVVGATVFFMLLTWITSNWHLIAADQMDTLGDGSFEECFRTSLFHTLTIASSAGFQAEHYDYFHWGALFWLPTMILMAMGGCASSTAGGLKVVRFVVLVKNARNEFLHALTPRSLNGVRLNGRVLQSAVVYKILALVSIYLMLVLLTVFALQLMGLDFIDSLGTAVSAFGNTGPALGITGPDTTWALLPDAAKWLLCFVMLVGRLEIFTVIMVFTPMFWRK